MNQIYFTADLHFGHSNILKHSPKRPFSDTVDIVAHDEWLLDLFIQQLTKDSSFKRQNVDFLMNVENVHKVNFQSHIVNREERIPYLIQLITDYYNWDWVDGTDMICLLRTSITAPLTDQEKERISKFFSNFSHLGLHHAEGTDEELGNDVSLTVIVAK